MKYDMNNCEIKHNDVGTMHDCKLVASFSYCSVIDVMIRFQSTLYGTPGLAGVLPLVNLAVDHKNTEKGEGGPPGSTHHS